MSSHSKGEERQSSSIPEALEQSSKPVSISSNLEQPNMSEGMIPSNLDIEEELTTHFSVHAKEGLRRMIKLKNKR